IRKTPSHQRCHGGFVERYFEYPLVAVRYRLIALLDVGRRADVEHVQFGDENLDAARRDILQKLPVNLGLKAELIEPHVALQTDRVDRQVAFLERVEQCEQCAAAAFVFGRVQLEGVVVIDQHSFRIGLPCGVEGNIEELAAQLTEQR